MFLTRTNTVRIGIVGFSYDFNSLFAEAAVRAGKERNCHVKLIWLAGPNGANTDARIIASGRPIKTGQAAVEITLNLKDTSAAEAQSRMYDAMLAIVDRLA